MIIDYIRFPFGVPVKLSVTNICFNDYVELQKNAINFLASSMKQCYYPGVYVNVVLFSGYVLLKYQSFCPMQVDTFWQKKLRGVLTFTFMTELWHAFYPVTGWLNCIVTQADRQWFLVRSFMLVINLNVLWSVLYCATCKKQPLIMYFALWVTKYNCRENVVKNVQK